jgi:transposase
MQSLLRWVGRGMGLDLHRDFCELAICEDGVVRPAGRVATTPEALDALAASLEPTDRVAMEVSGGGGRSRGSWSRTCSG